MGMIGTGNMAHILTSNKITKTFLLNDLNIAAATLPGASTISAFPTCNLTLLTGGMLP